MSRAKCPGAGRKGIMIKDDSKAVTEGNKCCASPERGLISQEGCGGAGWQPAAS